MLSMSLVLSLIVKDDSSPLIVKCNLSNGTRSLQEKIMSLRGLILLRFVSTAIEKQAPGS